MYFGAFGSEFGLKTNMPALDKRFEMYKGHVPIGLRPLHG